MSRKLSEPELLILLRPDYLSGAKTALDQNSVCLESRWVGITCTMNKIGIGSVELTHAIKNRIAFKLFIRIGGRAAFS